MGRGRSAFSCNAMATPTRLWARFSWTACRRKLRDRSRRYSVKNTATRMADFFTFDHGDDYQLRYMYKHNVRIKSVDVFQCIFFCQQYICMNRIIFFNSFHGNSKFIQNIQLSDKPQINGETTK